MSTRRERVIVEAVDSYTGELAKMAVATRAFRNELDHAGKGQANFRSTSRQMESDAKRTGAEIDKLSGRMRVLGDVIVTAGPGLIPVGAVGIAGVAGLASQFGFAAAGALSLAVASQGVGDALTAVNTAALEPTTANLEAARVAMAALGPEAQSFVTRFQELRPVLADIRDHAAAGWFPGLTKAMDDFERVGPKVASIMEAIGTAGGDLVAQGAEALAGPQWADFLAFVEDNAPQALDDLGHTVGNLALGLADLWMAFAPLNDGFSTFLLDASKGFAGWADGLAQTAGFQEFMQYVQTNGPKVADLAVAVGDAFLQIVEAAAPLGGPVLEALTAIAKVIATIADSDLGTPIFGLLAGMALLNRTMAVTQGLQKATFGGPAIAGIKAHRTQIAGYASTLRAATPTAAQFGTVMMRAGQSSKFASAQTLAARESVRGFGRALAPIGKGAAGVAAIAVAATGAADGLGLTNTASLALAGTMFGPYGTAIGGGIGLALDFAHAGDDAEAAIRRLKATSSDPLSNEFSAALRDAKKQIDDLKHSDGLGDTVSDFMAKAGGGDLALIREAAKSEHAINRAREAATQGAWDSGFQLAAAGADAATQSVDEFRRSLDRANAALTQRGAEVDYQAAIDDFTSSLKENGKTLDTNTAKGRANRTALDTIAASGLKVAEGLTGLDRAKFLDNLREQFIKSRKAIDGNRAAAEKLADELGLVDQMNPVFNLDTRPAMNDARAVKAYIDGLKGVIRLNGNKAPAQRAGESVRAYINRLIAIIRVSANTAPAKNAFESFYRSIANRSVDVTANVVRGKGIGGLLGQTLADGGTVLGPRYPYGDKILTYLAPTEEVITNRNGEADRFRADRAAGRIPRYADGGTVGGSRHILTAIDAGRLANGGTVGRGSTVTVSAPSLDGMAISGTFHIPGLGTAILEGGRIAARQEIRNDRDMSAATSWGGK